jgi:two-component sensor histidine kinase
VTEGETRILLVDDDEDDFVVVRGLLADIASPRCTLEWCATYDEGMARVMLGRHDVYLCDYRLGAHDGVEIVKVAAKEGNAPAILLTAHDDQEIEELAAAAGAADYLDKGQLTAPILRRAIRYALARHRSTLALQQRDREKAVLLKEIHHRVKNNLQIISSLLNFEVRRLTDPNAIDVLRETQTRVRSIALIHERLYETAAFAGVEMGGYARSLVSILTQALGRAAAEVRFDVRCNGVVLDVDTAVPCGLITNELVTNAIKHAFPSSDSALSKAIVIEIAPQAEGGYVLSVTDNGVGLPTLDTERAPTLGMQLVGMLARHMEGTVQTSSAGGTRISVSFRAPRENRKTA